MLSNTEKATHYMDSALHWTEVKPPNNYKSWGCQRNNSPVQVNSESVVNKLALESWRSRVTENKEFLRKRPSLQHSTIRQKYRSSHTCKFNFSSNHIGKNPDKINFNIFCLNIVINEVFSLLLGAKFLESSVHFKIGAHLKLDKLHFERLTDM